MTPLEALSDMERLRSSWAASPPEIQCLVVFAVAEIDRQLAARRNPGLAAMTEAVPDKLMREIVSDSRRGVAAPSSLASKPDAPPPEPRPRGTGWRDLEPLTPPPGVAIMDAMMDVQDVKDRAEAIERTRAGQRQAMIDRAWQEKLADEQAHREALERRSTLHKGVGDPDFSG
jgi:hypothetical protein